MLRFLRKYNKIILVVGGCLLMIAFLAQGTIDQLITQPGERPIGTIDGRDVLGEELEFAARDMRLLQDVSLAFAVHYPDASKTLNDWPKPLTPTQWVLMLADAKKIGLGASRSEAIALLEQANIRKERFDIILNQTRESEERVLSALQDWSIVQQYMSLVLGQQYVSMGQRLAGTAALDNDPQIAQFGREFASLIYARRFISSGGTPRVSEPMVKRFIYDQSASAEITAVEIKSDPYLNVIAAPTPDELKALFEKYKDDLPGEGNPYGFGYKYPDRVKLEYLKVPFDRALALIERKANKDKDFPADYDPEFDAELEANALEYYERKKDDDYIIRPTLPDTFLPPTGILPTPGTPGIPETPTKQPEPGIEPVPGTNPTPTPAKDAPAKDGATKDSPSKSDTKEDAKDAGKKSGNATDLTVPTDVVEVLFQDELKDAKATSEDADAKDGEADPVPAPSKDGAAKDGTSKTDATKSGTTKTDAAKDAVKQDDTKAPTTKDAGKADGKTGGTPDGKSDLPRVPVIQYQPFKSVRKAIRAQLMRAKAEELVTDITKAARNMLMMDVRSLNQENGYFVTDKKDWTPTSLSDVAKKIQDDHKLLPDVVRYDGEWLNEEAVKNLKDFGRALIGQNASAWQYVFSEKTFVEAGTSRGQLAILRLQAGVVSQPVADFDDSRYLFRVIAAEKAHAPTYEQRLDEVDKDARQLAAYKALLAETEKWNKRVLTETLEDIAKKESVIVHNTIPPFRKRVTESDGGASGLTVPTIGDFGKSATLTDAIFDVAANAFGKGEIKTLPFEQRSGAAAVDGRLSMVLFRVESYKPITERDYELQVMFNMATGMIQQGLASKDAADPLSEEALSKRVNFVRAESSSNEETENGDGDETGAE